MGLYGSTWRRSSVACALVLCYALWAEQIPKLKSEALAQTAAEMQSRSHEVQVPSDGKARYFLVWLQRRTDGYIEVTTRREGPSGTSYSTRLVDCRGKRFGYLADGDSLEEWRESRTKATKLGPLEPDSISYWISARGCASTVGWK